jgi:hypothetical protein
LQNVRIEFGGLTLRAATSEGRIPYARAQKFVDLREKRRSLEMIFLMVS